MKFLGIIEEKGLYATWNEEHGQVRYSLDGQEIAVYDSKIMRLGEPILFKNNTISNELSAQIKDQIQELADNLDIQELKEQERDIEDYKNGLSMALDIDEKDIISSTEIKLDEEIQEKDRDETKHKEKNKVATKKDINVKQELSLDAMATDIKTIGQILQRADKIPNIQGKKFDKLLVIESSQIKNVDKNANTNTTRFAFVLEATDGSIMPIDLEQDYAEGNNPREIGYRTRADGRVEQDDVNSRYIIGNKDETISIKTPNGPGNIEIGYSAHKTLGGEGIDGNESIDHELETRTVYYRPRIDSREQEYSDGYRGTEERAHEAYIESKHQEELKSNKKGIVNNDNSKYKDIDGNEQTKNVNHEFDIEEIARKLINENSEVDEAFTEEEVIKMLEKAHDEGKDLENIEEEIKEDANMVRRHRR